MKNSKQKMHFKFIITSVCIIFSCEFVSITSSDEFTWLDYIVEKINFELKIYQIRLFTDIKYFKNCTRSEITALKLAAQIPTITKQILKTEDIYDHQLLNKTKFKNSESPDLHFSLQKINSI